MSKFLNLAAKYNSLLSEADQVPELQGVGGDEQTTTPDASTSTTGTMQDNPESNTESQLGNVDPGVKDTPVLNLLGLISKAFDRYYEGTRKDEILGLLDDVDKDNIEDRIEKVADSLKLDLDTDIKSKENQPLDSTQ